MIVALVQTELIWENPTENRKNIRQKIDSITENIDLIVLPEMFTTGFSMHPETIAEPMDGETVLWMKDIANQKNVALTGSVIISENENFYNRLLFVFPSGEIKTYDKRHLFSLAGEQNVYAPGSKKLIVEHKGFRICPLICYDLRFPVFARNIEDYDVLIYVANWPLPRIAAWDALLKARSIENMCYTIGVNRIGTDDNQHRYSGHSQTLDFMGNHIIEPQQKEGVFITELNKKEMLEARKKFGFLDDRDHFKFL